MGASKELVADLWFDKLNMTVALSDYGENDKVKLLVNMKMEWMLEVNDKDLYYPTKQGKLNSHDYSSEVTLKWAGEDKYWAECLIGDIVKLCLLYPVLI